MGNSEISRVELPAAFVRRVEVEVPGLAEALDGSAPVSVRFNPFKQAGNAVAAGLVCGDPVPWTMPGEACYLTERPVFTADPVFHGGAYYVQEAGSMFVGWLLRRMLENGTVSAAGCRVLDLCAAPGGKTTHLASVVGTSGVVVANETIRSRARVLAENVQKWGTGNAVVTSNDPADFGERLPAGFDVVVADVPCSGEGMFRKDHGARAEWSPEGVELCAARQRRIVSDVWKALRPGGVLIYSTCTFNAAENEENVRWIAGELGGEVLGFDGVPEGIVAGYSAGGGLAGWHFYPHRVRSEGFFAAVIRKNASFGGSDTPYARRGKRIRGTGMVVLAKSEVDEMRRWISPAGDTAPDGWSFARVGEGTVYGFSPRVREMVELLSAARFGMLYSGVEMGELIRGRLKPAHALALYAGVSRQEVPAAELDDAAVREYLRKGTDSDLLPVGCFVEGLNRVTCRGVGLGWVKRIGNRYNNLYPAAWRVLRY